MISRSCGVYAVFMRKACRRHVDRHVIIATLQSARHRRRVIARFTMDAKKVDALKSFVSSVEADPPPRQFGANPKAP